MSACWSFLVILEHSEAVCRMCGVNQAHPIETDNRDSSRSHAFRGFVRDNVFER
jgi:hypothetical protein